MYANLGGDSLDTVEMVLEMPYAEGAAGVIVYLESESKYRPAELAHQLGTVTGPTGQVRVHRISVIFTEYLTNSKTRLICHVFGRRW